MGAYLGQPSGGRELVCQLIIHPQNHTIAPPSISSSPYTTANSTTALPISDWWVYQLHHSAHSDWYFWHGRSEVKVHQRVYFTPGVGGVLPERVHFRLHPLIITVHLPNLYRDES